MTDDPSQKGNLLTVTTRSSPETLICDWLLVIHDLDDWQWRTYQFWIPDNPLDPRNIVARMLDSSPCLGIVKIKSSTWSRWDIHLLVVPLIINQDRGHIRHKQLPRFQQSLVTGCFHLPADRPALTRGEKQGHTIGSTASSCKTGRRLWVLSR